MYSTLDSEGLMGRCFKLPSRPACDEDLLAVHPAEHISKVRQPFMQKAKRVDQCFRIVLGVLILCGSTLHVTVFAGSAPG